ncbi:MAG TPA: glycosyltransferase family 2 protein [Candidatus Saccharimonadales bacterium]|nr:glycosyltransferase family 2 protein [Candidatus Saccharimonadales bacterium]
MISGAEAHRIRRALQSVSGWVSEIVVVINEEVQDGTAEIAQSFHARVFREPWKGMIGQKASAAAKAASEWILDLDADEVVSDALREEIRRAFQNASELDQLAAFSYPRLSWYMGRWIRHGDWYPDLQTRLWRRGRGQWEGLDPHAKLRVQGRVRRLSSDLIHYSNESINRQVQKIIPFSDDFVRHRTIRRANAFELVVRPWWRFVRAYFLRLGFLDGLAGYYIARLNAFSTLTRYAKLSEAVKERCTVNNPPEVRNGPKPNHKHI